MENQNEKNHYTESNLQQVLILGSASISSHIQSLYSHKFNFLNPSSLPLHQFLATDSQHLSSLLAIVCVAPQSLSRDILSLFPSLRLVVTASVGTNHIDLSECRRRRIIVANAGNAFSEDVADMAVGLLIDVTMKISAADRAFRRLVSPPSSNFPPGSKLGDKKVGIIGLGKIGLEVARRLVGAFGCIVSYNSRTKKSFVSYPFYSNVVELATNSDVLVLCCALNDQTRHIINREIMMALGKGGVIINVGRGALIDEKELVKCLMEGEIGGAGLDVFENEPHVPQELFALDNVVLSPHKAALTSESYMAVCQLVERNLEAFFSNKPLITPVMLD